MWTYFRRKLTLIIPVLFLLIMIPGLYLTYNKGLNEGLTTVQQGKDSYNRGFAAGYTGGFVEGRLTTDTYGKGFKEGFKEGFERGESGRYNLDDKDLNGEIVGQKDWPLIDIYFDKSDKWLLIVDDDVWGKQTGCRIITDP
ncbi:MAG: hypothetical protein ACM3PP_11525, partial [Candidatus Saccharibacteria bacterium]